MLWSIQKGKVHFQSLCCCCLPLDATPQCNYKLEVEYDYYYSNMGNCNFCRDTFSLHLGVCVKVRMSYFILRVCALLMNNANDNSDFPFAVPTRVCTVRCQRGLHCLFPTTGTDCQQHVHPMPRSQLPFMRPELHTMHRMPAWQG